MIIHQCLRITFIAKIVAKFLTEYLPMARFASCRLASCRHVAASLDQPNWTMERDPDHWFSDHALTSWCSMIFMANEPLAGIVRFAFRRIFGAEPERPRC